MIHPRDAGLDGAEQVLVMLEGALEEIGKFDDAAVARDERPVVQHDDRFALAGEQVGRRHAGDAGADDADVGAGVILQRARGGKVGLRQEPHRACRGRNGVEHEYLQVSSTFGLAAGSSWANPLSSKVVWEMFSRD